MSLIELVERDHVDDIKSFQGVATDGSYLWTSDDHHIYKREMDGTLISTKEDPHLEGTDLAQVNHMCIHDGKIYIGSCNYDITPKLGYIKVFALGGGEIQALLCEQKKNPTDVTDPKPEFSAIYPAGVLSYIEEHRVLDHWCDGCAFHNNAWWVVYSEWKYVSKYDLDWNHVADYELLYWIMGPSKIQGYQGITWKGEDIYCTIHDMADPLSVDRYHWTGSGFSRVARIIPPDDATQGICYLASNDRFYIAQRHHPVFGKNSVTIAELIE